MKEEMAYVLNVGYGYVEGQGVGLQLEVRLINGAAMILVDAETANKMIEETKMGNVLGIKGKPVAVTVEDKVVKFSRFL